MGSPACAAGAQRKAGLERIEDEIDAIVCARPPRLWGNRPGALQVYGDVSSGYRCSATTRSRGAATAWYHDRLEDLLLMPGVLR